MSAGDPLLRGFDTKSISNVYSAEHNRKQAREYLIQEQKEKGNLLCNGVSVPYQELIDILQPKMRVSLTVLFTFLFILNARRIPDDRKYIILRANTNRKKISVLRIKRKLEDNGTAIILAQDHRGNTGLCLANKETVRILEYGVDRLNCLPQLVEQFKNELKILGIQKELYPICSPVEGIKPECMQFLVCRFARDLLTKGTEEFDPAYNILECKLLSLDIVSELYGAHEDKITKNKELEKRIKSMRVEMEKLETKFRENNLEGEDRPKVMKLTEASTTLAKQRKNKILNKKRALRKKQKMIEKLTKELENAKETPELSTFYCKAMPSFMKRSKNM